MSTIISIKNDNSYAVIDRPVSKSATDLEWSALGRAMGYPDSWTAMMKLRVESEGKSWKWKALVPSQKAGPADPSWMGGSALLIINRNTKMRDVREILLSAEDNDAEVSIVYTAKPPLIGEMKEGEVDQKFSRELQSGKKYLEMISNEAKKLGVRAKTSFVWAESSADLLKQRKFRGDVVINKAV